MRPSSSTPRAISSIPSIRMPAAEIVRSWGSFTPDSLHVADLAKYQAQASKLVDEVQYND